MTVQQLREHFNNKFGLDKKEWPKTYLVGAETYANVCQYVFTIKAGVQEKDILVSVALGPNKGIMFKGIELILDT